MFIDDAKSWVACLPFHMPMPCLPNDRDQGLIRRDSLHCTLERKPDMKYHFPAFMQDNFHPDHDELAPPLHKEEECLYLPSFSMYHPHKPGQIWILFDSSASHLSISLKDVLLTGRDLNNSLLGVLMWFSCEQVAVTADIEQMFHSFVVRKDHRNFVRFLWFKDNDIGPHQQVLPMDYGEQLYMGRMILVETQNSSYTGTESSPRNDSHLQPETA